MRIMALTKLIVVGHFVCSLFVLLLVPTDSFANNDPFVITITEEISTQSTVVVDVRAESLCLQQSLPNAICMPVEHVLTVQNRLANFSGLFWLLGSMGLDGSEHVSIIGDNAQRKAFTAGLLFIAGQARIDLVSEPIDTLLKNSHQSDVGKPVSGTRRANTRTSIFTAQPRTNRLILKAEIADTLHTANAPVLLDGRTESEYWGRTSNTNRGGHIPGALHTPQPIKLDTESSNLPVAYANNYFSGLAYLARLITAGVNSRLYPAGWAEWSSDALLPVDAESFLGRGKPDVNPASTHSKQTPPEQAITESTKQNAVSITFEQGLIVALTSLLLLVMAFYAGRVSRVRKVGI